MRCTKRQQPSAPDSDQSTSRSGGESESMNQRIVSAPNTSIMPIGAITFFFDFDIFSDGPMMTSASVPFRYALPSRFSTSSGSSQLPL